MAGYTTEIVKARIV
ncbi:hypothetical protein MGL_4283 [Malassezia globosa CBS 7966]|uniref:Uncharacterized protein n=1 Tax=Malassezia globosa (strain ATCC MYA-4612 / CBS 7966) TaxID=425265 RepID=A8QET8_MALGO|nr:hypothetical protein MGL_4283 [Malassezia globosa CBS 7966]